MMIFPDGTGRCGASVGTSASLSGCSGWSWPWCSSTPACSPRSTIISPHGSMTSRWDASLSSSFRLDHFGKTEGEYIIHKSNKNFSFSYKNVYFLFKIEIYLQTIHPWLRSIIIPFNIIIAKLFCFSKLRNIWSLSWGKSSINVNAFKRY